MQAVSYMNGMGFDRILGGVCAPQGFLAAGIACGIKEDGQPDLALVYAEKPASAAAVFTTNSLKAAPVLLSQQRAAVGSARAVVVSSGNANAMTGPQGATDALAMTAAVEKALDIAEGEVLVASTGPIGDFLPMDKLEKGIKQAAGELSTGGNTDAAKAIMTTDSYPKELALEMEIGGKIVRIGAMAKGAGMIHPNMATMISVITTDVAMEAAAMQDLLEKAVEWSFNRISVDGDQSTNDTVIMLANGAALDSDYDMTHEEALLFFQALCWLTAHLAMALVKDGEGATKLIRVVVNGARNDEEAVRVARAIANSNLVKCSVFGAKPDWGRVAAAIGSSQVPLEPQKISIHLGEHEVASGGVPVAYDPDDLARILERDEVEVTVDLGLADGSAYFLTCDMTVDYVAFNAGENS
jgi:glutamate N-acetyltransferase/amino-acid N-acetyltransferase